MAFFRDARLCVIILFLNYLALVVSKIPELSVRAIPVSPDTVVVTVDTVGGDKVDELRILYSDDSAITWTGVDDYNSQENYALVAGLQPSTKYVFNVSATVHSESCCVVTHVLTPQAGLSTPTNISVIEQTNSSILITWNYDGDVTAKGFIVLTENVQPNGSVRLVKHNVVFQQNEAVVDGLDSEEKYQVKVEPFDLENGTCSDPVLFQLNMIGETTSPGWIHVSMTTSPKPERPTPPFLDPLPEELFINGGETVILTCTAINASHAVVQWYKDNVPYGKPADLVNEIVLSSVVETTLLTCTATNGAGTTVEQIKIIVTPQIAPSFNGSLPETQLVGQGDDVRLWCSATGNPVPMVGWYKNDALVEAGEGSVEFVERRASRHFDVKCVATNDFGKIEAVTKVYIRDLLRKPSVSSQLPSTVDKYEGEQLMIPCSFHGDPTPVVTWYNGDTRLGDAVPAQNILKIDSVNSSAVFTCRGENLLGKADTVVQLRVIPKDPVLELKVNPEGAAYCWLTWSTRNMPAGLVAAYIITIRENGRQGDVIMHERHPFMEADFKLEIISLTTAIHYFVELDAVSQNGSVLLSASTLYFPGRNVTPFHVTSKQSDSGLSQPQSREGGSQDGVDGGSKQTINLKLTPLGYNQVRVDWTVVHENRTRPIFSYKLRVHLDGPEGRILHEYLLFDNTQYYTVYDLLMNTRYYIQLDALDKYDRVIQYVGYPYLVPPPGYNVEPIRTSTVFNKNKVTTTVSPAKQDRLSKREKLVISRVEAQGSDAILVEWRRTKADTSKPALETVVRYAEFTGNVRGRYKIETVPAGQQRLVIRHLKPDTTYGIQVSAYRREGWSKTVRGKTGPVPR